MPDKDLTGMSKEQLQEILTLVEKFVQGISRATGGLVGMYDQAAEAEEKFAQSQKRAMQDFQRQKVETLEAFNELTEKVDKTSEDYRKALQMAQEDMSKIMQQEFEEMSRSNDKAVSSFRESRSKMSGIEEAASVGRRQANLKQQQEELKANKDRLLALTDDAEQRAKIEKDFLEKSAALSEKQEEAKKDKKKAIQKAQYEGGMKGALQAQQKAAQEEFNAAKENERQAYSKLQDAIASGDPEQIELAKQQLKEAQKQSRTANLQLKASEAANFLLESLDKSVEKAMNLSTTYQAKLEARLQGTNKGYTDIIKTLKYNLAASPFVKVETVMQNIANLSQQGIAYNLEQRAFLQSIAEDIATTFDAANGTLLRLIKIQQQDTTGARLGMEAALTRVFNSMFTDTSYLGDLSRSVTEALLEAEAVRSRDEALELEYTVQKWLGALSSLGVGQGAIQSIAGAVGQLASGNIQQLVGTPMLTLLAMSASRGGVDFTNLTGGFSNQDINKILRGLVEQLQEVKTTSINGKDSSNLVVLNALSNVLGVNASDIIGGSNLSQTEINQLFKSTLDYSGANKELTYQLSQIGSRLSLQTMINNLTENALFSMGETIGSNPALYGLYKGVNVMESLTGGIHLPVISVMGNALDLSAFTVEDLIRGGVMGISAMGSLLSIVSSLNKGGGLSLEAWGGKEINERGGLQQLGVTGVNAGKSGSAYIASGSAEDMKKQSMFDAKEDESVSEVSADTKPKVDFDTFYANVVKDDRAVRVTFEENEELAVNVVKYDGRNVTTHDTELASKIGSSIPDGTYTVKVVDGLGEPVNFSLFSLNFGNNDTNNDIINPFEVPW